MYYIMITQYVLKELLFLHTGIRRRISAWYQPLPKSVYGIGIMKEKLVLELSN